MGNSTLSSLSQRVALFVDFENVFSSLRAEAGEGVAIRFANDPFRWLRWFERSSGGAEQVSAAGSCGRRVLLRTCYLNPSKSGRFRSSFTSAGFRVVDCPSVTLQGKNSADIHMVMDILDALAHPTVFEEFVILSGDADFRPVLLRLRAHDCRTAILTVGPSSSAYESASDQVIHAEEFVEQALGFTARSPASADDPAARAPDVSPAAPRPTVDIPAPALAAAPVEALRVAVVGELELLVRRAAEPMPLARAAQLLTQTHGEALLQSKWFGHGGFRRFAEGIPSASFRVSRAGAGFLYDPLRHAEPQDSSPAPARAEGSFSPLVDAVCRRTGAPRRSSREYAAMFAAIDASVREAPYQLMDTSRRARDLCIAPVAAIARADHTFLLRGLWARDAALLRRDSTERSPAALAQSFSANVLALAENEEMSLDDRERAEITAWIEGEVSTVVGEGGRDEAGEGGAAGTAEPKP